MSGKLMQTSLKSVVILTRNLEKTSQFYSEVVGLKMVHSNDNFTELRANGLSLLVRKAPSLAHASYGYSPILNFELGANESFAEAVELARNNYECELDGDVVEDKYMRLACIRTPDG